MAARRPVGLLGLMIGFAGALNGDRRRPPRTDPHHGDVARHRFHPVLTVAKSDWRVRREIRGFAAASGAAGAGPCGGPATIAGRSSSPFWTPSGWPNRPDQAIRSEAGVLCCTPCGP